MEIRFNVTGQERKALVAAACEALGAAQKYLGAPSFAYEIGGYTIDKNGTLTGDGLISSEGNSNLIKALSEQGFMGEVTDQGDSQDEAGVEDAIYRVELSDPDCADRMEVFHADSDEDAIRQAQDFCSSEVTMLGLHQLDEDYNEVRDVEVKPDRLILQMPLDGFTPEKLDNLFHMVIAKTPLLKVALDAEELPIRQTADTLDFPWFHFTEDAETVSAYTTLISLLCKTAKEKKRVTAKEREAPNPKYALRCFLLSLGFIGEEYKAARKVLLSRMEGNGSWKHGKKVEVVDDAVSE